jgi:hypothetical protein
MKKIIYKIWIASCLAMTGLEASTFTDKDTGLMWQDTKDVTESPTTYDDAIRYCEELPLGDYDDWRLPNITELKSIVDYTKHNPAIKDGFKNIASDFYWASSPRVSDSSGAWDVYFGYGDSSLGGKSNSRLVRCVRDSESLTFNSFSSLYRQALQYEVKRKVEEPTKIQITKGQFEKTADFESREVKEELRYQKAVEAYEKEQEVLTKELTSKAILKSLQIYYGKPTLDKVEYDADKESFLGNVTFEKDDIVLDVEIKMTPKEAEKFYRSYKNLKYEVVFESDDSSLKTTHLQFTFDEKVYKVVFNIDNTIVEQIVQ